MAYTNKLVRKLSDKELKKLCKMCTDEYVRRNSSYLTQKHTFDALCN